MSVRSATAIEDTNLDKNPSTMNRSNEILTSGNGDVRSLEESRKNKPQQVLVGWDNQKTKSFLALSVCFAVWLVVFVSLMTTDTI